MHNWNFAKQAQGSKGMVEARLTTWPGGIYRKQRSGQWSLLPNALRKSPAPHLVLKDLTNVQPPPPISSLDFLLPCYYALPPHGPHGLMDGWTDGQTDRQMIDKHMHISYVYTYISCDQQFYF